MDETELIAQDLAFADAHFERLSDTFVRLCAYREEVACRQWAIDLGRGIERARARIAALRALRPEGARGEMVVALIELGPVIRDEVCADAIATGIQDEHDEIEDEQGRMLANILHSQVCDARKVDLRLIETSTSLSQMKEHIMASPTEPPTPQRGETYDTGGGTKSGSGIKGGTKGAGGTKPAPTVAAPAGMDARLVYEAMSMFQRGTAQAARPVLARSDVAVRMTASSEALGLPIAAAIATIDKARVPHVWAQVADALQRNFAAVERDGVRSYRRLERPLVQQTTAAGQPTQHGLGLFRTASLKSHTLIVRNLLLDLRSSAATRTGTGAESERLLLLSDQAIADLLRCTADPMGLVSGEAEGAFRRLMLAVADWLDQGGIADADALRDLAAEARFADIAPRLVPGMLKHDRRLGPVGGQEAVARLDALVEALAAIATTIAHGDKDDTGSRAALAEQALTLIRPSAEALILAYEALGSTREEQDVAFFGGAGRVSLGQFAGWAIRLSDRFAGADMVVAGMTDADLKVLEIDLERLKAMGDGIRGASTGARRRLGMIGALGQLEELLGLIGKARSAVAQLIAFKQI